MREMWGVNDEGFVSSRFHVTDGRDPDVLSYDDRIRHRYLRYLLQHKHKKDYEWLHEECRSKKDTSRFLGYPDLPDVPNDIKSKYSFEEKFMDDYLPTNPKRLKLSNPFLSVVSLTSFLTLANPDDNTRLFTCSGFVIDTSGDSIMIVTSACLVCHADDYGKLKLAKNLKIKVRFGCAQPCYGSLFSCCLNYNIAFIKVKGTRQVKPMPMIGRVCLSDDVEVFAVGHHYLSGDIMVASGTTTTESNSFDCVELMFSTCKITKCGIGGPLVDSLGILIGMNFYDKNDTPYLPTCLILKCWYHVQCSGEVMQPYFGWKLGVIEFQHIHKIFMKHELIDAVAVYKVKSGSPAQRSGICDGDIIVEFCGEPAVFLAECAAVLLDKKLHNRAEQGLDFEVKIVRGEVIEPVRIYTNQTLDTRDPDVNRWPLPKLEWELIPLPRINYHDNDLPDEYYGYKVA